MGGLLVPTPRARNGQETAFLSLGEGAATWLVEAAAVGANRIRTKMDEAITLANCTVQPRWIARWAPPPRPALSAA